MNQSSTWTQLISCHFYDMFRLNWTAKPIKRVNQIFHYFIDRPMCWSEILCLFSLNVASIELYRRNKDIFLYAIDLNKKLYAIKILSSPFNGNASTFDEYLTKSLQDAVQLYERLALGACNIMRYPQITEVETTAFSSIIMQQKMELLKFGSFHMRIHWASFE